MTGGRNPTSLAADALRGHTAWLVGGALRDELLGRPTADIDIVVDGDAGAAARAVARAARGPVFELSDEFGSWRVMAPDRTWQIDLSPLRGGSLNSDLALRDFTSTRSRNRSAAASASTRTAARRTSPRAGCAPSAARSLADDPLRVVRLVRLAARA